MSINISSQGATAITYSPAPPAPPYPYSDWAAVVRRNYFANLDRLGQWNPQTQQIDAVTPSSLGINAGQTIYVVTHGWAPGYRSVVDTSGADLLWWDPEATIDGVAASAWAWAPVTAPPRFGCAPPFPVNPTGMLQSILAYDPDAVVLAWSWIDDSATDSTSDWFNLTEVYQSEAHTHANGLRLAYALQEAIVSSAWSDVQIQLIGHSHGSKVATVAALTLQQLGMSVAKLTILDSPETNSSLENYGANLLGCYLQQMNIADPATSQGGVYVDNYASYFGVGYASPSGSSTPLDNIVEFALNPEILYSGESIALSIGDCHTYAAGWYGGATAAASTAQSPLGFACPPAPSNYTPGLTLNQNWTNGVTQPQQWALTPGDTILENYSYTMYPMPISSDVNSNISQVVLGNALGYSSFLGSFTSDYDNQYGMTFTLQWENPQIGDYLVINIGGTLLTLYTAFVIDGQSLQQNGMPVSTTTMVAINYDVDITSDAYFSIYLYSAVENSGSQVTLSNFQYVVVDNASGSDSIDSKKMPASMALSA